jgi:hypothetical protein
MAAMPSGKVLMSTTGMDTNFGAAGVEGVAEVTVVVTVVVADEVAAEVAAGVTEEDAAAVCAG